MSKATLDDYITRALNIGMTKHQIRANLMNAGWPHDHVDDALQRHFSSNVPSNTVPPKPAHDPTHARDPVPKGKPLGVLARYMMVLKNPGGFFLTIKDEKGFEPVMKFLLFFMLIFAVSFNIMLILAVSVAPFIEGLDLGFGYAEVITMIISDLILLNILVLIAVGLTFVSVGILHIFVRLFGGTGNYLQTYKVGIYSSAPTIFMIPISIFSVLLPIILPALATALLIVPFICIFFSIWSLYLFFVGMKRLHSMTTGKVIVMIIGIMMIAAVLVFVVMIAVAMFFVISTFNPDSYTGRMPTGFTTLGAPSDWDVDSSGDVDITLNNRLASEIEIESIKVTTAAGSTTWDTTGCTGTPPGDLLKIGPRGSVQPSAAECPNSAMPYRLNAGPQTAGTSYSLNVEIKYKAYGSGLTHIETGMLTGTVI